MLHAIRDATSDLLRGLTVVECKNELSRVIKKQQAKETVQGNSHPISVSLNFHLSFIHKIISMLLKVRVFLISVEGFFPNIFKRNFSLSKIIVDNYGLDIPDKKKSVSIKLTPEW